MHSTKAMLMLVRYHQNYNHMAAEYGDPRPVDDPHFGGLNYTTFTLQTVQVQIMLKTREKIEHYMMKCLHNEPIQAQREMPNGQKKMVPVRIEVHLGNLFFMAIESKCQQMREWFWVNREKKKIPSKNGMVCSPAEFLNILAGMEELLPYMTKCTKEEERQALSVYPTQISTVFLEPSMNTPYSAPLMPGGGGGRGQVQQRIDRYYRGN